MITDLEYVDRGLHYCIDIVLGQHQHSEYIYLDEIQSYRTFCQMVRDVNDMYKSWIEK